MAEQVAEREVIDPLCLENLLVAVGLLKTQFQLL
jgi:hypothetical protein